MTPADAPLILDKTSDFKVSYKVTEDGGDTVRNLTGYDYSFEVSSRYDAEDPVAKESASIPSADATKGLLIIAFPTTDVTDKAHTLPSLPAAPSGTSPEWHTKSILKTEPHETEYNYIYQVYLVKTGTAKELVVRGLLAVRD